MRLELAVLMLLLLGSFAFADRTAYAAVYPDCKTGLVHFYIWINQSGMCGGCTPMTNGELVSVSYKVRNGTCGGGVTNYETPAVYPASCIGSYCTLQGDIINKTLFSCQNPNYQMWDEVMSALWGSGPAQADLLNYPGTCSVLGSNYTRVLFIYQIYDSLMTTKHWDFTSVGGTCLDVSKMDPSYTSKYECTAPGVPWNYYLYPVQACSSFTSCFAQCQPDPTLSIPYCNIPGRPVGDGNSYYCDVNGYYQLLHSCVYGGWQDCNLSSVVACPGVTETLRVANLEREVDRLTMTDTLGRVLQWSVLNGANDTGEYVLFNNQQIDNVKFRLLKNDSFDDWILNNYDQASVSYYWNATEANCSVSAGAVSLITQGSYYVANSAFSCALNAGYDSSNVQVLVSVNATGQGSQLLANGVISKTFTLTIVRDVALLDNFQMLYNDSTDLAVSGHIIRLSDLKDIPASALPNFQLNFDVYSRQNPANRVLTGGVTLTAGSGYSDNNFLYYNFSVSGGSSVGDIVGYNATVGANGYANSTYGRDQTYLSPYRVLYFKCRNNPLNVTFDTSSLRTNGTDFECVYRLANSSAISVVDLGAQSKVSQVIDVNSEFTQSPFEHFVLLPAGTPIVNPPYNYNISTTTIHTVDVPFDHSLGVDVYNTLSGAMYEKTSVIGVPQTMSGGRYVGRWGVLDNPQFYIVKTYVDLVVQPSVYSGFVFNKVSFNQSDYNEGDAVTCIADYFDPSGVVKGWQIMLAGMPGHSYSLTDRDILSSCDSASNDSCWYTEGNCTQDFGTNSLHCYRSWTIYGIQKCLSRVDPANNASLCNTFKWPFLDGKKDGTITCSVVLYMASGLGGDAELPPATAGLHLQSTDLFGMIKNVLGGFINAIFGEFLQGLLNADIGSWALLILLIIFTPLIIIFFLWRPVSTTTQVIRDYRGFTEETRGALGGRRIPGLGREVGLSKEAQLDAMERRAFDVQQQLRMVQLAKQVEELSPKTKSAIRRLGRGKPILPERVRKK